MINKKKFTTWVDLDNPHELLPLKQFDHPTEIKIEFQRLYPKFISYCYAFVFNDIPEVGSLIANIGMSDKQKTFDNRIYRKASAIPGWIKGVNAGCTSALDMNDKVIEPLERKFPNYKIHKDDVVVRLWDTSTYQTGIYGKNPTVECERQLQYDFYCIYGKLPIGNKRDETKLGKKPGYDIDHLQSMFEGEIC